MSEAGAQRIDVWLWHARLFKTRSLATAIVNKGRVRITAMGETRRISKASTLVRAGDQLTLSKNGRIVRLEIVSLATRRGPAAEAQALYVQLDTDVKAEGPAPQGET